MSISENIGLKDFNFFKYENNLSIHTQTHRDTHKELQQHVKGEYIIRIIVLFPCALTNYNLRR